MHVLSGHLTMTMLNIHPKEIGLSPGMVLNKTCISRSRPSTGGITSARIGMVNYKNPKMKRMHGDVAVWLGTR